MYSRLLSRVLGSLAVVWLVAGCVNNPASSLPPLQAQPLANYQLGSGDTVRVVVFGEDTLPQEYTVDERGTFSMPLAGAINAKGLTTEQLEKEIATKLKGVLVDPNVSVQMLASRPIYVVGGVNKPGAYPYAKDMTVLNAIAVGGGFTQLAHKDYFGITRQVNGVPKEFRATRDTPIHPEDTVYVYEMY